ncbi:unnamed protein product [Caenorhabditis bovis]|uniref:Catalase n=1 Tax=Caenorhabditis bovis TaxID=2654633 RepID=A0A8S1EQB8_9PELO|nr:unnamed protein product [Caenorhabditis bovis]
MIKFAEDQLKQYSEKHPNPENLTTAYGVPLHTKTASLTAGRRGPMLMQDVVYMDEMAHFDRERIPERVVHAKGAGAHGYFEVTHDITKYTRACVFSEIGKKTPMLARFSTVGGESGSPDTARDPRGFALKFYTEEGNWDLVGNNTPIFFIRDAIHFPNFIHTQKRNPRTHLKDPNAAFDFWANRPESIHQVMFLYSDRGTPDGYRHMNGYGSHTFKMINSEGQQVYCKFHFKPVQGVKNLTAAEAGRLAGEDPDYATRDLYEAIENGNYPVWTMYIQVMTFEQAEKWEFNPFDVTKVWPHSDYPLIEVGKMVLDKNPSNYFAEIEQAAFSPSRVIPGISFSPDKMLQGRIFSYPDTQFHRLGPNFLQLPINCPYRSRPHNTQRDGLMCVNSQLDAPNYFPNRYNAYKTAEKAYEPPFSVMGDVERFETGDDHNYEQPREFWEKVLNEDQRDRLCENIAAALKPCYDEVRQAMIKVLQNVHPNFANHVRHLTCDTVKDSASLAKDKRTNDNGRACAINFAMGHDDPADNQLKNYKGANPRANVITTSNGAPIYTKTAVLTAGRRGPMLMQDVVYMDEMAHFDRERIPERVVHAKGAGAHGYFEVTHDITKYTKANIFSKIGKQTPLFVRFSTVGGESGSADTARDPRGFAIKFYTEEGNWDLVGNNTPIFFIRDPIHFPNFIHTQKRNPQTHLKDVNAMFDFWLHRPEALHQVMFLFSDRGTPDGYRHMNGYGSHTFKLVNKDGHAVYCKFHFKPVQGVKNLKVEDANRLAAEDPDYSIRDLFNAIERGDYPVWKLFIQVMTFEQAEKWEFNPFDVTKVWPHSDYPLIEVGKMVLNRNPQNYFAEVEQSAFCPAHLVPGIEFSPDKMLQGRIFSYTDTHFHRLGPNYIQLPVNCPYRSRAHNTQRDGLMAYNNQGNAPNYFPNSFNGHVTRKDVKDSVFSLSGDVDRFETGEDHNYEQPRQFWEKVLDEGARERMCKNFADSLKNCHQFIIDGILEHFTKIHPDFGKRVRTIIREQTRAHL